MTFAFFARNAFEIFHFGGDNRWSNETNIVQLCDIATTLVILDINLNILYVLEFYVA